MSIPLGPFWIYRIFNDLGYLIYIGKTNNPRLRLAQHKADKAWIREAGRCAIDLMEQYAIEAEVLAAEAAAIRVERPLMNIEHNEGNPYRVNPHTMRYAAGPYRGQPYRPELYADVHAGDWKPAPAPRSIGRREVRRRPSARRPSARRPLARRRREPVSLWSWAGGWLVLAALLARELPTGAAVVGAAVILASGRLVVRKLSHRGSRLDRGRSG